jgi:hypothetical protein
VNSLAIVAIVLPILYAKFFSALKPSALALGIRELGVKVFPRSPEKWWALYRARQQVGGFTWNECLAALDAGLERCSTSMLLLREFANVQLSLFVQEGHPVHLDRLEHALDRYEAALGTSAKIAWMRCDVAIFRGEFGRALQVAQLGATQIAEAGTAVDLTHLGRSAALIPGTALGVDLLRQVATGSAPIPVPPSLAAQANALLEIVATLDKSALSESEIELLVKKVESACDVCNLEPHQWIKDARDYLIRRRNFVALLPA